jgi:hypothetical protein
MAYDRYQGYFGMQVNSPTERRIIFSVWDSGGEAVVRNEGLLPVAEVPDHLVIKEAILPYRAAAHVMNDPLFAFFGTRARNNDSDVRITIDQAPDNEVAHPIVKSIGGHRERLPLA